MHNLIITSNPFIKLRGLVGRSANTILLMENCCDIHTYTMKRSIDIVFLDDNYKVIDTYFGVKPRRRIRCKDARHVIERYSANKQWVNVGESIFTSLAMEAKGNISVYSENTVMHKNKKTANNNYIRRKNESMSSM